MTEAPTAPISSFCYCAAIILLGQTLTRGAAHFDPIALACAAGAIALVTLPLFLPPIYLSRKPLNGLIAAGVAIGFYQLPLIDEFIQFPRSRSLLMPFVVLATVAGILSVLVLLKRPRALAGGVFALLLLDFGLMGVFFLNLSASPHVDVYVVQELGCRTLLHGHNPFAMTFPDLYGPGAGYYPPRAVVDGQVQSGYFYPPLSLLLDVPGYLAGDLRFAHLGGLLIGAALIGYGRHHFGPAVLLLFTPQMLFILENAWIETFAVAILASAVWCADHRKKWILPVMVGLLLVTKQYLLLTIPAVMLLLPSPWRWHDAICFAIIALLTGSLVTLPFFLWSPPAFLNSMTVLYTNIIRPDSISFLPLLSRVTGTRLTLLCPLLAALPPAVLVLWRAPRTASGFAAAVALICLCVFAFSTQAFINYYLFAIAALCTAMATERGSRTDVHDGAAT